MTPESANDRIKLLGIKKQHIANIIGVGLMTLSHYLNNRRDLEYNVKEKLRLYLGL